MFNMKFKAGAPLQIFNQSLSTKQEHKICFNQCELMCVIYLPGEVYATWPALDVVLHG